MFVFVFSSSRSQNDNCRGFVVFGFPVPTVKTTALIEVVLFDDLITSE